MSTSTQKPKPRPRPRPRNATSPTEIDKPGTSSKSTLQNEDAMFIRNRNRNASAWSKINAVVEQREAARRSQSVNLDSSDSECDESPRKKKVRRPPFAAKAKGLPAWAKSDGLIHIRDSDSENESSSDASIVFPQADKDKGSPEVTPKSKRKRQRSRSRSDSPNPQVSMAEQIGRERARQILGSQPTQREKSPVYISDDEELDDPKELPAELAAIKAEVKRNTARAASVDNVTSSIASVELKIILRPHPEDESGRSYVYSHTMKRNEKFEQLFLDIADEAGIPSDRLIVLFNNHRVYPWSTPQTLSIWAEAELLAYEEHVYKYIKEHGLRRSPANDHDAGPAPDSLRFGSADAFEEPEPSQSQDKSDTFKLQVRSGEQTVTVSVRHTTKCSAIIEKVLAKMGKPAGAAKNARIDVDGEKLSPETEIGEAELEDGDLIDIVGA